MVDVRTPTSLQDQAFQIRPASKQTLSSEAVLDALKMMLISAPLSEVLATVCRLIEAHREVMLCSMFLLEEDGQHLRYAAAPNLPEAYRAGTDGACIGPNEASCGVAAYLRQPVFVPDIDSDPRWAKFRTFAVQSGLRAAWSNPIMPNDGKVLGTFCMFFREVRHPGPGEIQLLDHASRIAGIAIERDRSQSALTMAFEKIKKSEAELWQIVDTIAQLVIFLNPDGRALHANRFTLEYTGLSPEDVTAEDFRARVFHPEDIERLAEERLKALSRGIPFEIEQRARRKDGQYRWFSIRYNALLDEQGLPIRWYAAGIDIEDRKQAEVRTRNENLALREQIDRDSMFEDIVGSSEALSRVLSQVAKVAPSDSTVLILGETGTGKALIERAIHKRSKRDQQAFIGINCAAIPPSLIASELFGYEKGAFTGAIQRRLGRFESANGGTIFLDEVGDLPLDIQIVLLRVLQEREIQRVGGNTAISVDVRVLAATHRDLDMLVAQGKFRDDLLYRLNVVPIVVPSLRERADDLPLLVEYFITRFGKNAGKKLDR